MSMHILKFRAKVDSILSKKVGLCSNDLEDYDLYNHFDEDMTDEEADEAAMEAAQALLENSGMDEGLLEDLFQDN